MYSEQCSPCLPSKPPLSSGGCRRLRCFSDGIYLWARTLWVLINYLFFLPVMLPSEFPRLTTDSPVRVFPGVWKPLFLRLPSRDGAHPYLFCLSFCLLYFFLPPFEDNGLLFWVPDVLCQHSEAVLWNLLNV